MADLISCLCGDIVSMDCIDEHISEDRHQRFLYALEENSTQPGEINLDTKPVFCICGSTINPAKIEQHLQGMKHGKYLETLIPVSSVPDAIVEECKICHKEVPAEFIGEYGDCKHEICMLCRDQNVECPFCKEPEKLSWFGKVSNWMYGLIFSAPTPPEPALPSAPEEEFVYDPNRPLPPPPPRFIYHPHFGRPYVSAFDSRSRFIRYHLNFAK